MKKFALLLFPILLCFLLIACDFSSESGESSSAVESQNSTTSSTNDESSVTSSTDTQNSTDSSVNENSEDNNSQASDVFLDETEIIEATFNLPITVKGSDALDKAGFTVDSGFNKTVSVTVEATRAIINNVTASQIVASIDVSGVIEDGEIEFLIDYSIPDNLTVKSTSDDFVTVSITKKGGTVVPPSNPDAYITNGILISGNRGMEQFGGSYNGGKKTADKLNAFKDAVGENVNVYIMPCPVAGAFYAPSKYPNSITNHQNCFNGIKENLDGVKYVDTLSALSTHTDEYIYLRTDFHWAALGAYYAAQELAKVSNTPFDDISTFTHKSVEGFKGSLVSYAPVLGNDPDTLHWYEPSREHTVTYYNVSGFSNPITGRTLFSNSNGYTKFIYGDSYTTQIKSNVNNGRKLLVIKDSYGNALAPFLLSSFEEVIIIDCRHFKQNAATFVKQQGITDVCFAVSAFRVNGNLPTLLNY